MASRFLVRGAGAASVLGVLWAMVSCGLSGGLDDYSAGGERAGSAGSTSSDTAVSEEFDTAAEGLGEGGAAGTASGPDTGESGGSNPGKDVESEIHDAPTDSSEAEVLDISDSCVAQHDATVCITAIGGTAQKGETQDISSQAGTFAIEWDATPQQNDADAFTGLMAGGDASANYVTVAAIVRFSSDDGGPRLVDARNGGAYQALSKVTWEGGQTFHVRVHGDVLQHIYSVWVTPPCGSETLIAQDWAFRTEQAQITSVDRIAVGAETGTIQACDWQLLQDF
jgi:hypothetical protein